jgi:hypothetical protein
LGYRQGSSCIGVNVNGYLNNILPSLTRIHSRTSGSVWRSTTSNPRLALASRLSIQYSRDFFLIYPQQEARGPEKSLYKAILSHPLVVRLGWTNLTLITLYKT